MTAKRNREKSGDKSPGHPLWPTLFRLARYAGRHWGTVVGTCVLVIMSTAAGLVPPWIIRLGVDDHIMEGRSERLWALAASMVLVVLFKGLFDFLKRYLAEVVAQNVIHDLRTSLYQHLNELSFSFYDDSRTGDLMSRVTADADELHGFLSTGSIFISSNLLTIVGILGVMLMWELRLALLYVMMLPLMVLGMYKYSTRVRPMFGKVRKALARLTETMQEDINGIKVTKLFGQQKRERQNFESRNRDYIDTNLEAARVSSFWMPYANFLMGLGTALVVWYGGRLVINDVISFGVLAGFVSYIALLLRPVRQTGMMINRSSRAVAAGERIFEVLDTPPDVQEADDAYPLPDIEGEVCYEKVCFSYSEGTDVLKDISFEVSPGQTVAIVGPTGAGKSTLIHLLPRFYDPNRGRILIDGHDISEVSIESLRKQIGIVLQDTFLFGASIKENISYGKPEADMARIIECARTAQIHAFIESLPLGYETPVGERGVSLSGGQKQRLAMARVLLTEPRLLILDEPTSSLDSRTEDMMQRAMEAVLKNRTTFVIAHRLWTVENADRIIVLRNGEIAEQGRHQDLISRDGGFYREVYDSVLDDTS